MADPAFESPIDTSAVPWPGDSPEAYDTLYMAVIWPGVSKITAERAQKIDKKKGAGRNGATLTFQGVEVGTASIVNRVWLKEDFPQLLAAIAAVEPVPGKAAPQPIDVIHPHFAMRNITAVAIESIDGPTWDESNQWFETKMKVLVFRIPPKATATSTPSGSKSTVSNKEYTEPLTPAQILAGAAADAKQTGTEVSTDTTTAKKLTPPSKDPKATGPGV